MRVDGVWHRRLPGLALTLALVSVGPACLKRAPQTDTEGAPRATPRPHSEAAQPVASASPEPRAKPDVPEEIERSRTRTHEVLGLLADRELTVSQREERDTAVSFLAQLEAALAAGDPERAGVLAEKARILVENLERATRP